MARVLLVVPNYQVEEVESTGKWLTCAFVSIAGELRNHGHVVLIYDAKAKNHSLKIICSNVCSFLPDMVLITAQISSMPFAVEILASVKGALPQVVTIIGGIHVTFCYEKVLAQYADIDFVIRGEGERTVCDLIDTLEQKKKVEDVPGIAYRVGNHIIVTEGRSLIDNLDSLTSAWDLVEWRDYTYYVFPGSRLGVISTSRGCNHPCRFCGQPQFWQRTWRARSANQVVAEIECLARNFQVDVIRLADEAPTQNRERWEEILDRLIQGRFGVRLLLESSVEDIHRDADILRKYRRAGIIHVYISIEPLWYLNEGWEDSRAVKEKIRQALSLIREAGMISEVFLF